MSTKISISSCAFPGKNVAEVEKIALENDFIVEFSSGFRYEEDLIGKFSAAKCKKWIHNYFPPPKDPFVLNLASMNNAIWNRSVAHARQAIRLAQKNSIPFYSVHAGFCLDPSTEELGRKIQQNQSGFSRSDYWNRFISTLKNLSTEADKAGVNLFVENNVTIVQNMDNKGGTPLLCSEPDEARAMVTAVNHSRFGLLLDTAHLKISAQSLGFTREEFIEKNKLGIKGIHHSDNDGTLDNNKPLTKDYWFLKYMKEYKHVPHTIEVNRLTVDEVKGQIDLLEKAMMG